MVAVHRLNHSAIESVLRIKKTHVDFCSMKRSPWQTHCSTPTPRRSKKGKKKNRFRLVSHPRIELGSPAWQARIIPLNQCDDQKMTNTRDLWYLKRDQNQAPSKKAICFAAGGGKKMIGPTRESNSEPPAPEAGIIPLDQRASKYGESGHRSPYLPYAKRALYHLS